MLIHMHLLRIGKRIYSYESEQQPTDDISMG